MEHQAELENDKPQLNRVDAPTTAFLDLEYTEERQVMFKIGGEISYTKDGTNEKAHILTGTFYNEEMNSNLRLESGEEIITHANHIARLDDTAIP